jgi:hypothetical protein
MKTRTFKVTLYVESDSDDTGVFQETVEETIFKNRDKLISPPCIVRIDKISAEEIL